MTAAAGLRPAPIALVRMLPAGSALALARSTGAGWPISIRTAGPPTAAGGAARLTTVAFPLHPAPPNRVRTGPAWAEAARLARDRSAATRRCQVSRRRCIRLASSRRGIAASQAVPGPPRPVSPVSPPAAKAARTARTPPGSPSSRETGRTVHSAREAEPGPAHLPGQAAASARASARTGPPGATTTKTPARAPSPVTRCWRSATRPLMSPRRRPGGQWRMAGRLASGRPRLPPAAVRRGVPAGTAPEHAPDRTRKHCPAANHAPPPMRGACLAGTSQPASLRQLALTQSPARPPTSRRETGRRARPARCRAGRPNPSAPSPAIAASTAPPVPTAAGGPPVASTAAFGPGRGPLSQPSAPPLAVRVGRARLPRPAKQRQPASARPRAAPTPR